MPENRSRRPRQPGPVSDIERFLMEVERLRKKSADERQTTVDEVQVVDDVVVVRPAPPPVRAIPVARPRSIEAAEVAAPAVLEVVPVQQSATDVGHRKAPAATATVQATQRVATISSVSTITDAPRGGVLAREVVAMLRSKQQVRAAMILREILDQPACRRRRR